MHGREGGVWAPSTSSRNAWMNVGSHSLLRTKPRLVMWVERFQHYRKSSNGWKGVVRVLYGWRRFMQWSWSWTGWWWLRKTCGIRGRETVGWDRVTIILPFFMLRPLTDTNRIPSIESGILMMSGRRTRRWLGGFLWSILNNSLLLLNRMSVLNLLRPFIPKWHTEWIPDYYRNSKLLRLSKRWSKCTLWRHQDLMVCPLYFISTFGLL